jgi:hypothetical protein
MVGRYLISVGRNDWRLRHLYQTFPRTFGPRTDNHQRSATQSVVVAMRIAAASVSPIHCVEGATSGRGNSFPSLFIAVLGLARAAYIDGSPAKSIRYFYAPLLFITLYRRQMFWKSGTNGTEEFVCRGRRSSFRLPAGRSHDPDNFLPTLKKPGDPCSPSALSQHQGQGPNN